MCGGDFVVLKSQVSCRFLGDDMHASAFFWLAFPPFQTIVSNISSRTFKIVLIYLGIGKEQCPTGGAVNK